MEIKPFRAVRFNEAVVGDVGSCIAPPYDVIDSELQERLYKKSKYNIVQITKGKTSPSDNPDNNQYTRAAKLFNDWLKTGVLKQDTADTIYGYIQDFQIGGRKVQRISFVALSKLEELGKGVRPHEFTLAKPKIDRLNLRRATKASFGLVFMLYQDDEAIADKIIKKSAKQRPLIDFTDEPRRAGVRHRLFVVTDAGDTGAIGKMMSSKTCVIADGHHRYEAALNYYKETGDPNAQYVLTAFVNARQKGLLILATHRLMQNVKNFDFKKFLVQLQKDFDVATFSFENDKAKKQAREKMSARMKVEFEAGTNAFGIYAGDNAFYVAALKDKRLMDAVAPDKSEGWKGLDVAVLHKLIIEKHLGIDEQGLAEGGNIEYVKDTGEAIDDSIVQVDKGDKQAAFFVNPTRMEQIEQVTAAGERMPQKSTFFYPKVFTGLTIHKL
jgi:uncharacterized protein (DUF1015 family)